MTLSYRLDVLPDAGQMQNLWQAAWGGPGHADWSGVLARSLCWVTAHDQAGTLQGFVNVAWDGGIHAFLLDTSVHPSVQRRGVGAELVRRAAAEAAQRGMHWLHVDYEPHLEPFYAACGFRPTHAGLLRLQGSSGEAL